MEEIDKDKGFAFVNISGLLNGIVLLTINFESLKLAIANPVKVYEQSNCKIKHQIKT